MFSGAARAEVEDSHPATEVQGGEGKEDVDEDRAASAARQP